MSPSRARAAAFGVASGVLALVVGLPSAAQAEPVREAQWHLRFLHVDEAHRYSEGSGVVVAVVDTGVDGTHPDLAGNVTVGAETFLSSKGGNGWTDVDGHGTNMAGLIAAHGHGNGDVDGALGIAPRATILPVRAGVAYNILGIPEGVDWAVDHGARVISISAGGREPNADAREAVERALKRDVVVVAASGNRAQGEESVGYPAAYPGVVAVGGVDQNGNHASDAVTGPEIVLSAPSVDIVSTALQHKYGSGIGTSAATAIVAGAVALVRAKFPKLSAAEVIHRLTATAIDKGPKGRDDEYGYGIVNLVGALTADVPPLPASPSASPSSQSAAPRAGRSSGGGLLVVGIVLIVIGGVIATRYRTRRDQ